MDLDDSYQSDSGTDSDAELQEAFESGKLQPGLNIVKERPVKTSINNEKVMRAKLDELRQWVPWLERLDSTNRPAPLAPQLRHDQEAISASVDDGSLAEDDFKREALFYRQAQAAVLDGLPKLHALRVPTLRPDDYLAQMVKTDQQMDKVRKFLIKQKTSKEMSEKARKLRELKKTGKRTQIEAQQRKLKEKKDMLEKVKKFRKGVDKNLDFLEDPEEQQKRRSKTGAHPGKAGKKRTSGKREQKDARFGFGGRKRGSKRNTAESASDTGWLAGKGNKGRRFVTKKSGKPGQNKRPGKQTRQKIKSKSKRK